MIIIIIDELEFKLILKIPLRKKVEFRNLVKFRVLILWYFIKSCHFEITLEKHPLRNNVQGHGKRYDTRIQPRKHHSKNIRNFSCNRALSSGSNVNKQRIDFVRCVVRSLLRFIISSIKDEVLTK